MNLALKIVGLLALVAMIALVGRSLLKRDETERVPPRDYTMKRMDIEQSVYGSGVLRCSRRAEIAAREAGKIRELLVEEGAAVQPSQVLCKMSNDELENNFAEAKKDFQFAKDEYHDKEKSHAEGGPPSEAELKKLKWELDKKKRALDKLEERVKALTVTVPPELKGTVLKSYLDNNEIKLNPDKVYPEGTVLFVVGDLTTLVVEGTILESDRDKVREGDTAVVHLGKKGRFPAKVTNLSLIPLEGGRYHVRLDFDTPPSDANEGLTVDVRIIVEKKPNVLVVPVEYVAIEAGRHWVQRVEQQNVTRVPIEVGISSDSFYEVKSGLKEGDIIRWNRGTRE